MTRHRALLTGLAFVLMIAGSHRLMQGQAGAPEAPTGLDGLTNGFVSQADVDAARELFEERDDISKGLGPVYNGQSCVECHQNPVTGAASQVTVVRAGHFDGAAFIEHPGGSLIQDRTIAPWLQEHVLAGNEVRTLRISLSTLGDGFIEAIDDRTITDIAASQPANMRGEAVQVPVCSKCPGARAWAGSAGKRSTPVCCRSRPTPT